MKLLRKNFKLIISFACLLGICYPIYFNYMHPEITSMELLKRFWWLYVLYVSVIAFCVKTSE